MGQKQSAGKKGKKKPRKPLTAKDRQKLAIMEQLGLMERVRRDGWGSLSAQECGQVGGLLSRTLREQNGAAGSDEPLGNTS